MTFYENLKELALTPSELGEEVQVRNLLKNKLNNLVDIIQVDDIGNLYVLRKGSKKGTIMFSAHQDKVMDSTHIGWVAPYMKGLESNLIFEFVENYKKALDNNLYVLTEEGYEQKKLIQSNQSKNKTNMLVKIPIPSYGRNIGRKNIFMKEELDMEELYPLDEENLYVPINTSVDCSDIQLNGCINCYALGFKETKKYVQGKLDDSVGLSLIIDLFKNTKPEETPTMFGLFTIGEEEGFVGANYYLKKGLYKKQGLDEIIVIDTTMLGKLNSGIVLYKNCGRGVRRKKIERDKTFLKGFRGEESLVNKLKKLAKKKKVPLTIHNAFPNDSRVFAQTGIPTVALEVPIRNMHSSTETCSKSDIEIMRQFLKGYLVKY